MLLRVHYITVVKLQMPPSRKIEIFSSSKEWQKLIDSDIRARQD